MTDEKINQIKIESLSSQTYSNTEFLENFKNLYINDTGIPTTLITDIPIYTKMYNVDAELLERYKSEFIQRLMYKSVNMNNNVRRSTFNTNLMIRPMDSQFTCSKCGGEMYNKYSPTPKHSSQYKCKKCGYETNKILV